MGEIIIFLKKKNPNCLRGVTISLTLGSEALWLGWLSWEVVWFSGAVLPLRCTVGTSAALSPGVGWYWPHTLTLLLQQARQACSRDQGRVLGEQAETLEASEASE